MNSPQTRLEPTGPTTSTGGDVPASTQTLELQCNDAVLAERVGHVLLVTLNRPDSRNAVNTDVTMGVGRAMEAADADPDIRVVIITGAGDRAFCAGADLKEAARTGTNAQVSEELRQRWGFAGYTRHAIAKPTIAAVNGFALGGGTELVLASDLAIAVTEAKLGLPEVSRGVFAAAGGAFRLPRQIPAKIAMEMILTATPISAQKALELGLINRVVKREDLLPAAFELAEQIARNSPVAVQISRRVARAIEDGRYAEEDNDWGRSRTEGTVLRNSADMQEGLNAFAERREPRWLGR
jgi:crotonobetainyl-CoA hydratase